MIEDNHLYQVKYILLFVFTIMVIGFLGSTTYVLHRVNAPLHVQPMCPTAATATGSPV